MRRALLATAALPVLAIAVVLASAATDQPHRYFRDGVTVEASREQIWSLLTEVDRYHEWNPYLTSGSGIVSEGEKIELHAAPYGENAQDLDAEVLVVHPRRKLEWETRVLAPGLLDHEQTFRVLPLGPHRFRIVQEARFEGVLAPFADLDGERGGLLRMLRALAARAAADYRAASR